MSFTDTIASLFETAKTVAKNVKSDYDRELAQKRYQADVINSVPSSVNDANQARIRSLRNTSGYGFPSDADQQRPVPLKATLDSPAFDQLPDEGKYDYVDRYYYDTVRNSSNPVSRDEYDTMVKDHVTKSGKKHFWPDPADTFAVPDDDFKTFSKSVNDYSNQIRPSLMVDGTENSYQKGRGMGYAIGALNLSDSDTVYDMFPGGKNLFVSKLSSLPKYKKYILEKAADIGTLEPDNFEALQKGSELAVHALYELSKDKDYQEPITQAAIKTLRENVLNRVKQSRVKAAEKIAEGKTTKTPYGTVSVPEKAGTMQLAKSESGMDYLPSFPEGVKDWKAESMKGLTSGLKSVPRFTKGIVKGGIQQVVNLGADEMRMLKEYTGFGTPVSETVATKQAFGQYMKPESNAEALGQLTGSIATSLLPSALGGAIGMAPKAMGAIYGFITYANTYANAREKGASPLKASGMAATNAVISGILETYAGEGALKLIKKYPAIKDKAGLGYRLFFSGFAGGTEETTQQFVENAIMKYGVDRTVNLLDNLGVAFAGGFIGEAPFGFGKQAVNAQQMLTDYLLNMKEDAVEEGISPEDFDAMAEAVQKGAQKVTEGLYSSQDPKVKAYLDKVSEIVPEEAAKPTAPVSPQPESVPIASETAQKGKEAQGATPTPSPTAEPAAQANELKQAIFNHPDFGRVVDANKAFNVAKGKKAKSAIIKSTEGLEYKIAQDTNTTVNDVRNMIAEAQGVSKEAILPYSWEKSIAAQPAPTAVPAPQAATPAPSSQPSPAAIVPLAAGKPAPAGKEGVGEAPKTKATQKLATANTKKEVDEAIQETFSAREEDVAEKRERIGLNKIASPEVIHWRESLATAIEEGIPERALHIAAAIEANPRTLTHVETAGMVAQMDKVWVERRKLLESMESTASEATKAENAAEIERLNSEIDAISSAIMKSGPEAGRDLVARKMTLNEKFEIMALKTIARAKKGSDLTYQEKRRMDYLTKQIDESRIRLEKMQAKIDEMVAQNIIRDSRKTNLSKMSVAQKDAELASLVTQLQGMKDC